MRKLLLAIVLLLPVLGCPKAPPPKKPLPKPEVEVEELPPTNEMLELALKDYEARKLASARKTLGRILVTNPQHLEARVLLALVAEAAGDAKQAAEAWTEVERILVYRGKLEPFVLQHNLFAAARYYVEADRKERARLFLDELWRRFPQDEWSVKAQLMLAESEFARGRWTQVIRSCAALGRLRPGHSLLERCGELSLSARRMLEVGPDPSPGAHRWVWEHPVPQGNPLNDVWVGADGMVVAVGEAGTVLQRIGARGAPRVVDSGTRWSLRSVWGSARDNVYAVGAAGVVVRFDGTRWQVLRKARPAAPDLWSVYTAGPGHLVAVGDGGAVVRLEDGKWDDSRPATVTLRGVWGASRQDVYAVGDGGLLLRLDGSSWRAIRSDSYEDLWSVWGAPGAGAFSPGRPESARGPQVFVVGNRKTVVRVEGDAAKESVVGRGNFRDVWGFSQRNPAVEAWAVGTRGEVIHFNGRTWRNETTNCLVDLFGVAGASPRELWAVGDGGTLLQRRGGRTWSKVAGGLLQNLVALSLGPGAGEGTALGRQGMLLQRSRAGTWRQSGSLPLLGEYRDMWSNGARSVAVGERGLMVVREGKKKWERLPTVTAEDLNAVWGSDGGVVAVGTRGTIVSRQDDTIVREQAPTGLDLRDVWGDGSRLYAVGNRGVVLRHKGEQWTALDTGVLSDLHAIWGLPGGKVFAVGEGGVVLELVGGRFRQHASPISQTLVGIWGSAEDALFAVSRQGAIIRYDGKAWVVERSPAACLTAVHGDPATGVLAVGCHGTVLRWSPQ